MLKYRSSVLNKCAKIFVSIGFCSILTIASTAKSTDLLTLDVSNNSDQTTPNWRGVYVGAHSAIGWGSAANANISGMGVGAHGGYNWQYYRSVLSLEADITYANINFKGFSNAFRTGLVGTGRARAGFLFDRWLVYGTGGVSIASKQYTDTMGQDQAIAAGWVAGAGVEAPITEKITVRGEYLHHDLGSDNFVTGSTSRTIDTTINMLRGGVQYKF